MAQIHRLTKTATKRIRRNPSNALAAILVMFLTFFVMGIFYLVSLASNVIIHYYETRPQVTAFLKDDTTTSQVESIKDDLKKIHSVTEVKYISKDEALKIYKERNKDEPILSEFVTADILPSSLEVSSNKIADFGNIANNLKNQSQVSKVVYYQEIIDTLMKVTTTVRWVGLAVVLFLLLTSITVTLIVIGLNISLHKEEIEIMKLVGATKTYVRTPFIIEGVTYGFISAFLATVSLAIAYPLIAPLIEKAFNPIPLFPTNPLVFIFLLFGEMFIGFVIGSVGAWIATRRYLEV
ncbi:MAG TPA: permease-like cell division protein FtsX [Candidatus Saccharimonadales bacterium]|nr:permease-like cell division protein FtsX [Candidatus Saccharimonadales bacterium]